MSNNRKQQAEYDMIHTNKRVHSKLRWSVLNKWRRHNFDWDLSRSAYKKKIEKIMDKLTKESMKQEQLVQPSWCNYRKDELGDAATPALGCWSLLAGRVTSEEFCKSCDLYKKQENGQ